MGSFFSSSIGRSEVAEHSENSAAEGSKRMKMSSIYNIENPRLIPSLPDEITLEILARVPRICYMNIRMVSRRWRAAITGPEVFQLRKELGTTEEWLYVLTKVEEDKLLWHALDPSSGRWQRLPMMPNVVYEEPCKGLSALHMWNMIGSGIKIADVIRGWLGRRDGFNQLPFCGSAVGVVDGCLYVLGGFSRTSAINCVWRYDPCVNAWEEVSSMATARAFSKTSLLDNKLYVVGGVTKGRGGLTPLRSAEVYDQCTGLWTEVPDMPFFKARALPTAFLAELLKPIATGMTSYKGKLCVPQSLYSWPFFVDVGGEMYDPQTNSWEEMPVGMGEGWPAKQASTKLSAVANGVLYALDPSHSLDSGKIKFYDDQEDAWKVVIEKVPLCGLSDSESPYLLAGFHGKLHVITKCMNNDIAILQAELKDINTSSTSLPSSSTHLTSNHEDKPSETQSDVWKVIAAKSFGASELVSCEVLDV